MAGIEIFYSNRLGFSKRGFLLITWHSIWDQETGFITSYYNKMVICAQHNQCSFCIRDEILAGPMFTFLFIEIRFPVAVNSNIFTPTSELHQPMNYMNSRKWIIPRIRHFPIGFDISKCRSSETWLVVNSNISWK